MTEKLSKRELSRWPRVVLAWTLMCGLTSSAQADPIPFSVARTIDASFDGAISLAAGDLDGDGIDEIVGAATVDGDISFWRNTAGDGSAWTETLVEGMFPGASSVHVANLDSRLGGSLDILAVSNDNIRIWRNTSNDASTWAVSDVSTAATLPGPTAAIPADIDGNGALDVVAVSTAGIAWWSNRFSIGQIWDKTNIDLIGGGASSVAVADVDGDGDVDVLVTFYDGDEVAWYENTMRDGSAWTRRSVATLFEGAQAVTAGDLDGDGDLDIAGTALIDDAVAWWENTMGDGSAWVEHTVDATVDDPSSVEARDMDGDGDLDLLTAAAALGEMQWFDNTAGDGSAWTTRDLPGTFSGAAAAIALDLDDDGDQDVVGAALGADDIAWWENQAIHRSAAYPTKQPIAASLGNVRDVHRADVDGDGDEDLLVAIQDAGDVLWWENTAGDGSAWTEHTIDADYAGASGVYAGDLDGDGDLDVYATSATQNNGVWWANLAGDGSSWGAPFQIFSGNFEPSIPQIVDIDADGTLDVMAVMTGSFRVTFWRNLDGLGTNWFQSIAQGNYREARSAHAVDIDGDGDADLATAASFFNTVSYVRNGLSLGYQVVLVDDTFTDAFSTYAADLDDDGDRDIVAASRSTGEIAWWENTTGDGDFGPRRALATGFVGVTRIAAADLDGDGDDDVFGTSATSHQVVWWENSGDGSSWTEHVIDSALSLAGPIVAADPDGDGQLDLVAAGGGGAIEWWSNRGGEFALPTTDVASALIADGSSLPVLRIDAKHRGRAGDSAVELATVEILLESTAGTPMTDSEANDLLAELSLYADDGSGSFEPATDSEIASLRDVTLDAGVATLTIADGESAAQIAATGTRSYFVVPTFEATASSTMLDGFRFTHVTEASSTGEDAANDLPLTLEFSSNVATTAIGFNTVPVAQDDAVTLLEDQSASGNVLDGTAGGLDSDADGTSLTAVLVTPPSNGTLIGGLAAAGSFQYMPNADFAGVDTFTYRADDGLSQSQLATVTLTVTAVNDAPSFDLATRHTSSEDGAAQTVPGFASRIMAGPTNESGQVVTFSITSFTESGLFATLPAIAADGTLTYEATADAVGISTMTVRLMDDGGTANGGVDQSIEASFDIEITAVNDAPSFTLPLGQAVSIEDAGAQSVPSFATEILAGPDDEIGQVVDFSVTGNTNPTLFTVAPALASDGTLTYTAAADGNGSATITVRLMDDGGTADGGVDQSATQSFDIVVDAVNDAPSFAIATQHVSSEDAGPQGVSAFATSIGAGPADEAGQGLAFSVTDNSDPTLFTVAPALASDGTLTYTAAADGNGSATITVRLMDDGGTADGGVDQSATQSFDIVVDSINDPPTFTLTTLASSLEDAGAQSVPGFAAAIGAGPVDEAGQGLAFSVTGNTNPTLFAVAPALASDGTLTYAATADGNGSATITVQLMDDGGTADGGVDQSDEQSFDIEVAAVNDRPSFVVPAVTQVEAIDAPQTLVGFATSIRAGPLDETTQSLQFQVQVQSGADLFAAGPDLAADGTLTFTLVPGVSDRSASLSATLMDDGGLDLGGADTSLPADFDVFVPDAVAPRVDAVIGPNGVFDVCTEVRRGIAGLAVRFSESMANDSPGDPGSVTHVDSYQLIASGPDQDVTTTACDALDGDDRRIAVSAVDLDRSTTDAVEMQLPGLLDEGLYKLLVCDTLQDASGNPLAETVDVAFRVSTTNRFVNGQVDCDLTGWVMATELRGTADEVRFRDEDADGSSLSGSIGVTSLGSTSFAFGQCLDVAVTSIDLAARVRVEGASDVEVTADLRCDLFAQPGCAGSSVGESARQFVLTPTQGVWQQLEHSAAGSVSAICGLDLHSTSGSRFEAFVDQLTASTVVFVDGFESGTIDEWSSTVP